MKLLNIAAIPALALTAGLSLAACGGSGLAYGNSTPAQICSAVVGNQIENSSVVGYSYTRDVQKCTVQFSDGSRSDIFVTLFPNGSVGWHR